jgi:hypothetical protein
VLSPLFQHGPEGVAAAAAAFYPGFGFTDVVLGELHDLFPVAIGASQGGRVKAVYQYLVCHIQLRFIGLIVEELSGCLFRPAMESPAGFEYFYFTICAIIDKKV